MNVVYLQRWLQLFPFLCSSFFAMFWLSKNWRSLGSLLHLGWPCDLIWLAHWWKHVPILSLGLRRPCMLLLFVMGSWPASMWRRPGWPVGGWETKWSRCLHDHSPPRSWAVPLTGSSSQTYGGAQLTLEEPANWAQSKCQPTELRAEGRFWVSLSHWLLECLLHTQSLKRKWSSTLTGWPEGMDSTFCRAWSTEVTGVVSIIIPPPQDILTENFQ